MKSIWTGSIGFGLVNIPIKLFSAIESSKLDFDMLDKKDLSNIKFKRVNEKTNKEVLWENIVKGYLLNDRYVVLDDKDFEKAAPEKNAHIEIVQFVEKAEIETVYYETPYFVVPDKSGTRAYNLLKEALNKSKKAGLGSFVMREREHVCLILEMDDMLILNRLRFPEEIRKPTELKLPAGKAKPAEVKMAITLINQLTKKFSPKIFKDDYSDKLLKIIKAKAKGKKIAYKPMTVAHSKSNDLMAELQASLSKSKKKAS